MPNDKAKELTAAEILALERGDEPVATCKDYLQVQSRISQLEEMLDSCKYSDAHHRNKCKELQARIEELEKLNSAALQQLSE